MGKWNRWGRTLAAVVLAAAVVCGCGVKETLLSGRKSEREYGKAETMVIVTTERQIWQCTAQKICLLNLQTDLKYPLL